MTKIITDPLFHDNWILFNEEFGSLKSHKIELGPSRGTAWELKTVLYENKEGQLVVPLRNPYLPANFVSSTDKIASYNRRKRLGIEKLAEYIQRKSVHSSLIFSPILNDMRPFSWSNMVVTPRYTYYLYLENIYQTIDKSVFKKAEKAKMLGYTCVITDDFNSVRDCLHEAENRKSFDYLVSAKDLKRLSQLLPNNIQCFLVLNSQGVPVGARITLFSDSMALAWSAGMKSHALKDGVNHLLGLYVLEFAKRYGCQVFDFVGANIPAVAEMKEAWGGELVPYYSISPLMIKNFLRYGYLLAKRYFKRN